MKLKTRRRLLIVCVILFLMIFPLVALNSFGYGYDAKEKKLVRTGIIYITANPQDNIKIFVNGQEEKEKLSVKGIFKKDYVLFNLIPQNYDIRIFKDGYSGWEKRLSVAAGVNTYARPLLLPLNPSDKALFEDKDIFAWSASLNFKKIAYLKKTSDIFTFFVYNTENKKIKSIILNNIKTDFAKTLLENSDFKAKFYWDSNSENIIIEINSKILRFIVLNNTDDKITYLRNILPEAKIIRSAWAQNNTLFIFQTDQKELYYVNFLSSSNQAVKISDNISAFTAVNNIVYYLDAKNLYLYSFSLDNPINKKQISNEPFRAGDEFQENSLALNSQIFVSDASDIAVIDPNKNLFIIERGASAPIYLANNINFAEFSADSASLLYNSPWEIYTYSLGGKTKNLITRLSQKIEKISWYKDYEHIWFINNNIIKNIEIDSRPTPNIIDFANLSAPIQTFTYNTSANLLYYDQTDNGILSIHELMVGN